MESEGPEIKVTIPEPIDETTPKMMKRDSTNLKIITPVSTKRKSTNLNQASAKREPMNQKSINLNLATAGSIKRDSTN